MKEKKTIKMKELEGLIIESVQEVLQERKKLNEDVNQLIAAIGGPAAIGGATYGIVKLVDALENCKFGENGKKVANFLRNIGKASKDATNGGSGGI